MKVKLTLSPMLMGLRRTCKNEYIVTTQTENQEQKYMTHLISLSEILFLVSQGFNKFNTFFI